MKKTKLETKLFYILRTILLFILFFSVSSIPIIIFKIDINKFSDLQLLLYSFACDIVFLIIIVLCYFKTLKKDFKPYFKNFLTNLEEGFKYYIIGLATMIVSNLIITFLLGGIAENEESVRSMIDTLPFLMIIEVSLYAPFAEELLFRKSIRDAISNKWLYIFVSGFIFGALHVISSVDSNNLLNLLYLIPYCSLGFSFAYIYAKTNNIYSTICIHSLHNTATILLYLIGASL